ncbi:hypothetical protein T310_1487 [Rasamsonia emersonii CBS 393.64]|uniref:Uncharacterized protein n=1 Tax=Rasamsonia emersonii (strain ATCC 16479 / CBS 393.64 / IMI 116815) TaxID=1408163 RepID=A0A0F4Z3J5_RASE3|nr:hypothetical protein T310_1487 [Rasamsonia emersonii CBS 393.64]KKA24458.1 hypothetical protein T310_1487 [Rasamsonia emersonii CBS 393.64]
MLAGINGVEVAQSLVIACLLLANDALYLSPFTPYPHPAMDSHLFSMHGVCRRGDPGAFQQDATAAVHPADGQLSVLVPAAVPHHPVSAPPTAQVQRVDGVVGELSDGVDGASVAAGVGGAQSPAPAAPGGDQDQRERRDRRVDEPDAAELVAAVDGADEGEPVGGAYCLVADGVRAACAVCAASHGAVGISG